MMYREFIEKMRTDGDKDFYIPPNDYLYVEMVYSYNPYFTSTDGQEQVRQLFRLVGIEGIKDLAKGFLHRKVYNKVDKLLEQYDKEKEKRTR